MESLQDIHTLRSIPWPILRSSDAVGFCKIVTERDVPYVSSIFGGIPYRVVNVSRVVFAYSRHIPRQISYHEIDSQYRGSSVSVFEEHGNHLHTNVRVWVAVVRFESAFQSHGLQKVCDNRDDEQAKQDVHLC